MKKKSIIFLIAIILAVSITGIIFIMPGKKAAQTLFIVSLVLLLCMMKN